MVGLPATPTLMSIFVQDNAPSHLACATASSSQVPCLIWPCFTLFPLTVWQEIGFHARLTCQQRTNTLS